MLWIILIGSSKNGGRTSDKALARSCLRASPFPLQSISTEEIHCCFRKGSKLHDQLPEQCPHMCPYPLPWIKAGKESKGSSHLAAPKWHLNNWKDWASLKHFKPASQVKVSSLPILHKKRVRVILSKPLPQFSSIFSHSLPAAAYSNLP